MASYYARRSVRESARSEQARAAAAQRYRRAMPPIPSTCATTATAIRAKLRQHAVTITHLRERAAIAHSDAGGRTLARILREEVAGGRVELVPGRYYRLNGKLPADVGRALRQLS